MRWCWKWDSYFLWLFSVSYSENTGPLSPTFISFLLSFSGVTSSQTLDDPSKIFSHAHPFRFHLASSSYH